MKCSITMDMIRLQNLHFTFCILHFDNLLQDRIALNLVL
jgi:hypothetical protein